MARGQVRQRRATASLPSGVALGQTRCAARLGFTLTELLVVIAILVILSALGLAAAMRVMGGGRDAATRSLIEKVSRGIQDRMQSVAGRTPAVLPIDRALAGGNEARALVIAKKRLLKEEFPQWFEVIRDASGAPVDVVGDWDLLWVDFNNNGTIDNSPPEYQLPAQVSTIAQGYRSWVMDAALRDTVDNDNNGVVDDVSERPYTLSDYLVNHRPETTMAECLYMILTRGPGDSQVDPSDFPHSQVEDSDGDGLPEITDGYGNPIRFYRWPVRFRSALQKGDAPYDQAWLDQQLSTPPAGQPFERRDDDPLDSARLLMDDVNWLGWQVVSAFDTNEPTLMFENARSMSAVSRERSWWGAFHAISEPVLHETAGKPAAHAELFRWRAPLVNPWNPGQVRLARAYKSSPLVVSAGPDEMFGLDEERGSPTHPFDSTILSLWHSTADGSGTDADNISNHNLGGGQ